MKEKKISLVQVWNVNAKQMALGLVLMAVSLAMPEAFNIYNFKVIQYMEQAVTEYDQVALILAALRIVALNVLRACPLYMGIFFAVDSMEFKRGDKGLWPINCLLIIGGVPAIYKVIFLTSGITYDFGLPAVVLVAFILLFRRLDYRYISTVKKMLLIFFVLAAVQFLDIMPAMESLPVGRGEISNNLKLVADVLDCKDMLNAVGAAGIVSFSLVAAVISLLLRDENTLRELAREREINERIRVQAQINEMKNRTYQEIQYLVHDLKSPLTSVQTLVGIVKMGCQKEGRGREADYLTRIEESVERMSGMISEILYEDKRTMVKVQEVTAMAMAQASVSDYAGFLYVEDRAAGAWIRVNRILMCRVLINLFQNSYEARRKDRTLSICLSVDREERGAEKTVVFRIRDNGKGIAEEERHHVWEQGVSGGGSSGLGLAFVRKVVEQMNGTVDMEEAEGGGTCMILRLPEERDDGEDCKDTIN